MLARGRQTGKGKVTNSFYGNRDGSEAPKPLKIRVESDEGFLFTLLREGPPPEAAYPSGGGRWWGHAVPILRPAGMVIR